MAEEVIRVSGGERESLAESHIKEQVTSVLRSIEDEVRELMYMIRDLDEGKGVAVERRHSRIRNIKDNIENFSINLMEYIIRTAPVLTTKDVYASIVQNLHRVAEHLEAAAYRNLLLSSGEFTRMPDDVFAILDGMVKKILNMVDRLESMISKVGRSDKQVRELYIELLKTENSVDEYYREAGIKTIKYYANKDVGALILVKELFDKVEETADLLMRVGTYIRYLSIQK